MSTNATFPPYEMVADGEGVNGSGFEGIDVEIAYALADKLGLELVIDDMDFDAALMAVQNNSADMMLAGLSYSEERDEVVDFSDPYATGVQVVIVKEGSGVTMDNLGEYMICLLYTSWTSSRRSSPSPPASVWWPCAGPSAWAYRWAVWRPITEGNGSTAFCG